MTKALTINGTDYTVTRLPVADYYRPAFQLTSKRGASYRAFVNEDEMGKRYVSVTNAQGKEPKAFWNVILRAEGDGLAVAAQ